MIGRQLQNCLPSVPPWLNNVTPNNQLKPEPRAGLLQRILFSGLGGQFQIRGAGEGEGRHDDRYLALPGWTASSPTRLSDKATAV